MSEVELKLRVDPAHLMQARGLLLAEPGHGRATQETLVSVYFDTERLDLHRRDMLLRVRKEGRRYVQTVKAEANGDAGPIERGEWEDDIGGETPDLGAPEAGGKLRHVKRPFEPLFRTNVRRTSIRLAPRPGTVIEAAIDEGEIQALKNGARQPLSEIELELESGDRASLYDVALRLLESLPVGIETRSKAERGYRLLEGEGEAPPILRAAAVVFAADHSVETVLQRLGAACLWQLQRNEAAALWGAPEGVHQSRVAVRRLRSAFSALKPMLSSEHYGWVNGELKWIGEALGPARNWDVLVQNLVEPVQQAWPTQHGLGELREAVERATESAYGDAREALRSKRYTAALLRLGRWLEARGWRDQPLSEEAAELVRPIGECASGLVRRRYKTARKRSGHFRDLDAAHRHRLRISLKKLRYIIEIVECLYRKPDAAAFLGVLKPLQDDLGDANDLRVAEDMLRRLQGSAEECALARAAGVVLGWHRHALAGREHSLVKHVRRFREAEPFW